MWRRLGRRSRTYSSRGTSPGRVSLGGGLTGLMVALSSTFVFAVLAGAVLQGQGHDLNRVVRGDTAWASAGAGTAFAVAVFLSFMWGGYTAGRMGGGSGAKNGALVPVIALLVVGALAAFRIGVQGMDTFNFPFGVGSLPLDANFTPLGYSVVAGVFVCLLAGAIWGGIIGARWHMRLNEDFQQTEYEKAGGDSFTDLAPGRSRY